MPNLSDLFYYNGEMRLEFIVWPIFLGICIGAFITVFVRVAMGKVVRAIFSKGACSPETACTLRELGVEKSFFIKSALRGKSVLRRVISAVNVDEVTGEIGEPIDINGKPDLEKSRFYIAEESRDRAGSLYDDTNSTVISALVTVLLGFVVAVAAMYIIPWLLDMIDRLKG
ncbi:MAG: hypothetical protein IKB34_03915 [Clostridia bacterium]|nr:hypothetical protein [Clostridia bacterium]